MSKKGHRLTKIQRWEMRREMLSNLSQGYSLSSVIDALVKQYGVTSATLYKDWQRRDKWIPQLVKIDDPDRRLKDLLLGLHESQHKGWIVYRQALKNKNENAAIGALKHIASTIRDEIEILQSLGQLAKAATKIDAFISTPGTLPWEEVPEFKEAVEKLRVAMQADKNASTPA